MSEKIAKVLKSSRPVRMWIDGKCFNIKIRNEQSQNSSSCETSILEEKNLNNLSSVANIKFPQNEKGLFHTSFELPKFYYQKLQTQEKINIKNLSEKTQTEILIPENGQEGKIEMVGENEENLKKALDHIHSIIASIRDKNIALQFSTIPLLSEEIQSNFEKFKKEVLEDGKSENIDETVFVKKEKLHLTINIFVLHNEREIEEATNVLNDFKKHFLVPLIKENGPLKINVKGIDCMTSNYKKINVLYAKAQILGNSDKDILQTITDELAQHFYEKGLMKRPNEKVKIHMTLINTKFRKEPGKRKRRNSKTIDATNIMEKYKNFEFGTCEFNTICIAHMFTPPQKDGFYKIISKITLQDFSRPENISDTQNLCESNTLCSKMKEVCEDGAQIKKDLKISEYKICAQKNNISNLKFDNETDSKTEEVASKSK